MKLVVLAVLKNPEECNSVGLLKGRSVIRKNVRKKIQARSGIQF